MKHNRFFCPVGQGGFSIENIAGFIVVYDCGSTSAGMVESCVDHLRDRTSHIDILFISHFDKDHVSGIKYLLSFIHVRHAVTAFIPADLKTVYGVYTNGAYTRIMSLLHDSEVQVYEIGSENETRAFPFRDIWEWVAKSMMSSSELSSIKSNLASKGFDMGRLSNANYVENQKKAINDAFKEVFGAKGPNSKGLIVLSQPCKNTKIIGCTVYCESPRLWGRKIHHADLCSCLFVGDADLKSVANKKNVKAFLLRTRTETELLFMQIPHHGSPSNIGVNYETDFPAKYYIVNDRDTIRLQKSPKLFKSLASQRKLLVTRDLCSRLVYRSVSLIEI